MASRKPTHVDDLDWWNEAMRDFAPPVSWAKLPCGGQVGFIVTGWDAVICESSVFKVIWAEGYAEGRAETKAEYIVVHV